MNRPYWIWRHRSALQDGNCGRVRGFVRACALEIKPGMLRAACFIDVRVWTRIRFDIQDGNFHGKEGVIQYGLHQNHKNTHKNINILEVRGGGGPKQETF